MHYSKKKNSSHLFAHQTEQMVTRNLTATLLRGDSERFPSQEALQHCKRTLWLVARHQMASILDRDECEISRTFQTMPASP